jgi:8-oxo-dGTP pyrophosphatase MutT (NUDIX family)
MAQKYKVFFYANILNFSTKTEVKNPSTILYKFTDFNDLQSFLFDNLIHQDGKKVRIICADVDRVWEGFCKFFEVRVAAGGLVINPRGELLFIKRKGLWDLPKGHLEKKESIAEAALREVEEECGISGMIIVKPIVTTYHAYLLNGHQVLKPSHWFLMEYNGPLMTQPQTKEEITQAVWVNEDQVDELLADSFPSVSRVIKKWKNLRDVR